MITKAEFAAIESEINSALDELLRYISTNCKFEDYLFLLADGEYKPEMVNVNANPYVIDYIIDKRADRSRMKFFSQFAEKYYSFDGFDTVDNDSYRTHLEMMIFTHLWESEQFLKVLFRLAELTTSGKYAWEVEVPRMGKQDFIRTDIRDKFEAAGLSIAEIMKKGYHSSLRNAFAHSQYYYNENNNEIELHNYTHKVWELQEITFDDWSKRFCYSIWLNYSLHRVMHNLRVGIVDTNNTNKWLLNYPVDDSTTKPIPIEYNVERDTFHYSDQK